MEISLIANCWAVFLSVSERKAVPGYLALRFFS